MPDLTVRQWIGDVIDMVLGFDEFEGGDCD
jgi:hypothetical protein